MKNLLISAALLLSSSVAMAKPVTYPASGSVLVESAWKQPKRTWNPNNTTVSANASVYVGAKPFLQDRIHGGARWRPSSWVQMTEPTRIDGGREFFNFGAKDGRFSQIQLLATHGSSHIEQVVIEFVDGRRIQKHVLNTTLVKGQAISMDLEGTYRHINRIVVYGSTAKSSAFQLLAR